MSDIVHKSEMRSKTKTEPILESDNIRNLSDLQEFGEGR